MNPDDRCLFCNHERSAHSSGSRCAAVDCTCGGFMQSLDAMATTEADRERMRDAAPELYQALKDMVIASLSHEDAGHSARLSAAVAALQKARGE